MPGDELKIRNMLVRNFIEKHNLRPGDAVEVTDPIGIRHFVILLNNGCQTRFIGNLNPGVQILTPATIEKYVNTCEVTDIERFPGSEQERRNALRRAVRRCGENAYNIVFNNCEHFKNWVLHNRSTSAQVAVFSGVGAAVGLGMMLVGLNGNNKGLEKAGRFILLGLLIVFIIAFIFLVMYPLRDID
jgi:hypothetical protein